MLCPQSNTNSATIPWAISNIKRHFPDPGLVTRKNGLKFLLYTFVKAETVITLNR